MDGLIKENHEIECKECSNKLPKEFWPTYSAFANTKGGYILLGYKEIKNGDTTSYKVTGVNNPNKVIEELMTLLNNNEKVSHNVIGNDDISIQKIDEKEIISVYIKEAPINKKPVYLNQNLKSSYIRLHESDIKIKEEQLKRMFRNAEDDLDSDLLFNYSLDDLDLLSIQDFRELLANRDKSINYADMRIEDFLQCIGAMGKDRTGDGNYKLKVGGLLFFGKYNAIIDKFPHYHLDYQNKTGNNDERWKDRVSSGDTVYANLNLFKFFKVVAEKLKNTIFDDFSLNDELQRTSKTDIDISLREALANAIIHADYYVNTPIKIEVYKSNYIFSNPGDMKISIAEFVKGGESKPRNPTITTLFRRIGFCERAGTGGQRIYQTAVSNKFRLPEIDTGSGKTTISIWKSDIVEAFPDLSENDSEIYRYINKNVIASVAQIIKITGISNYYVRESLKNLEEKNLIVKVGKGRATKYSIIHDDMSTIAFFENMVRTLQNDITKKHDKKR